MSHLPCNECRTGPREVEGHAALALRVSPAGEDGPQKATFHCGSCGVEWIRTYMGSGVFTWHRAG